MRINLFDPFNESLQDAALVWLMSWAAPDQNGKLHDYSLKFLKFLYEKSQRALPRLKSFSVVKQDANIDIYCLINQKTVLLIEDKVGTQEHDDQLRRYLDEMKNRGYTEINPFYVQTGDQSNYEDVNKAGYTVITRKDLLAFFNENKTSQDEINNQILNDYVDYLLEKEARVQSYKVLPLNDWHYESWIGFYQSLQERLGEGKWDYVPNAAGGFLGFWWHFGGNEDHEHYLQLEQERGLCFKIDGNSVEDNRKVMYQYRDHLVKEGPKYGVDVENPTRLRAGIYTTVAVLGEDYRKCNFDGTINMNATVGFLKALGAFLDLAMKDMQA